MAKINPWLLIVGGVVALELFRPGSTPLRGLLGGFGGPQRALPPAQPAGAFGPQRLPSEWWFNPTTEELIDLASFYRSGETPGPGFRPASDWEIDKYGTSGLMG